MLCDVMDKYEQAEQLPYRNRAEKLFVARMFVFYSALNARIASAVLATAIPSVCLSVCLSVRPSVRPSVRLSVTRRYCIKTAARSTVQFAPHGAVCAVG